jgi:hypothetical protein
VFINLCITVKFWNFHVVPDISICMFLTRNFTLINLLSPFLFFQINVRCSDRNFAYKLTDEMHDPWIKKLFLGFARTSEFNGPREPNAPNPMIQEVCTEFPIPEPMLQLPYRIFGSSPPMSNFDPAKMLTVSLPLFLVHSVCTFSCTILSSICTHNFKSMWILLAL